MRSQTITLLAALTAALCGSSALAAGPQTAQGPQIESLQVAATGARQLQIGPCNEVKVTVFNPLDKQLTLVVEVEINGGSRGRPQSIQSPPTTVAGRSTTEVSLPSIELTSEGLYTAVARIGTDASTERTARVGVNGYCPGHEPKYADLVPSPPEVAGKSCAGNANSVKVSAMNQGQAASLQTTVELTAAGQTETKSLAAVPPGGSTTIYFHQVTFYPLTPTEVTVTVDPGSTVAESNENNNQSSTFFTGSICIDLPGG